MSWSHFHFKCRFLTKKLELGLSPEQAIKALDAFDVSSLFQKVKLSGAPARLFDEILLINRSDKLLECLKSYNAVDMSEVSFNESMLVKQHQKTNYMIALAIIYFIVGSIFKVYVLPNYFEVYRLFDGEVAAKVLAFDTIYVFSTLFFSLFFILVFILIRKSKNLDEQLVSRKQMGSKLFSNKMNSNLCRLSELVLAPIDIALGKNSSKTLSTLTDLKYQNIELSDEFKGFVVDIKMSIEPDFNKLFNRYFSILQMALYLAIGYLITAMYTPIFSLGAVIS
ncbi:hypothetical protein RGQ13_11210 [Thalassotalea psychrophila]|uniref:Type II secretion system protein GspF domain-containing protein n=1 Tax=Thalassotalea psychrophila TaxID=3065647 RepID=A0ABY9TPC9_9GAMM|nr:hypothetical protein RGQ13_11210 [Colwelliaceae bacterium SQ149]